LSGIRTVETERKTNLDFQDSVDDGGELQQAAVKEDLQLLTVDLLELWLWESEVRRGERRDNSVLGKKKKGTYFSSTVLPRHVDGRTQWIRCFSLLQTGEEARGFVLLSRSKEVRQKKQRTGDGGLGPTGCTGGAEDGLAGVCTTVRCSNEALSSPSFAQPGRGLKRSKKGKRETHSILRCHYQCSTKW
jgi:hypothetical protein